MYQTQSSAAQRRLQRITEEWEFAKQAQEIVVYDEALKRGVANKEQEQVGFAIARLWRAVALEHLARANPLPAARR